MVAWFLLGPGSSTRVPSVKMLAGEACCSVLSAARTVQAVWMFTADIIAVFHIGGGQE